MGLKLSDLRVNQVGIIKDVIEQSVSGKLFEFGILPGATIKILSIAPFSGPIFIQVDNTRLALRKNEASAIIVE